MSKPTTKSEQDDQVVNAQGTEQQAPETDAAKRVKILQDFLKKTDPFELVALKALIETGGSVAKIETMPQTCINSINYCLNAGAYKSTVKNTDMMHQHRVQKATEMLDRHKKDIDAKLHCGVLQVLVIIATNADMVKAAFSKLADKPTESPKDADQAEA